ncbi:hypothetical protein Bca4012_003857 [Brassica carinata]
MFAPTKVLEKRLEFFCVSRQIKSALKPLAEFLLFALENRGRRSSHRTERKERCENESCSSFKREEEERTEIEGWQLSIVSVLDVLDITLFQSSQPSHAAITSLISYFRNPIIQICAAKVLSKLYAMAESSQLYIISKAGFGLYIYLLSRSSALCPTCFF